MNKKLTAGFGVLALALSVSTAAFAHGAGFHGGGMHSKMCGKDPLAGMFFMKAHKVLELKKELSLTGAQVDSIKSLKLDVKKALIRQTADIEILNIDLFTQLKNDTKDSASIDKLIDEKYEVEKSQAKLLSGSYAKLTGILNDKQLETLKISFEEERNERGNHYSHESSEKN